MIKEKIHICQKLIESLSLNLSGLTVITECASGDYAYTPVMAAMAGARVMAIGKDTRFGSFLDNEAAIKSIMLEQPRLRDAIECHELADFEKWDAGDIITNSGMLRPFDKTRIRKLKKSAVLPLMWETWEFREGEIDIAECQKCGIIVTGTNEGFEAINMYEYPGLMAMKLILDMKVDPFRENIAVLGGGLTGYLVTKFLRRISQKILWFVPEEEPDRKDAVSYANLKSILQLDNVGLIIVAEHTSNIELIGKNGYLSFETLQQQFPYLRIGHICGNIDVMSLKTTGLRFLPMQISSFGYMSFLPDAVSEWPVLSLNAGGLKVGEILACARKDGATIEQAIELAVQHGIGQDFKGGFMNYHI